MGINAASKSGETALMIALLSDHVDAARRLIEAGADVKKRDEDGWTTLMSAAFGNCVDMIDQLLGAGVEIDAKANNGETALMIANRRDSHLAAAKLAEKS